MRRNDHSSDITRWSTRKLIRELRDKANLTRFSPGICDGAMPMTGDTIREATRLYRETWVNPLIDELARRLKIDA